METRDLGQDLERDLGRDRVRAARWALVVGLVVWGLKIWAWKMTGSHAIFSDAAESVVNVVTAFVTLRVVRFAADPADEEHPYGHGKAESVSSAFEGGMVTIAACLIGLGAVESWFSGFELRRLGMGSVVLFSASALNGVLGAYLVWSGRKSHSSALTAAGWHVLSDFGTSLAALVALGLVSVSGQTYWDPLLALVVALLMARAGWKILWQSTQVLLDAEDRGLLEKLAGIFSRRAFPGMIRIHHTRVVRHGDFHHIDAHLVIPEFWDIAKAHEESERFEGHVLRDYETSAEISFHLDPCRRVYCGVCDLRDCPIRQEPFKEKIEFTVEELRSPVEWDET